MKKAYILHRYPYQESSSILKCFTRDVGLLTIVARGARKGKSRWRGVCQPFMPLVIDMKGRGSVLTLTHAEVEGQAKHFHGRILVSAFYLNELLLSLLPEYEAHYQLFDHYQHALSELEVALEPTLRSFELALLDELGYGLCLTEDCEHHPVQAECYYRVLPGELPQRVERAAPGYSGRALLAIAQKAWWEPGVLLVAKHLLRHWINHYTHGRKFTVCRQLLAKEKL